MSARRVEHVMGTAISIATGPRSDTGDVDRAFDAVFAWFRHVDEVFSTYKDDSEIMRLGRGEITLADCSDDVVGVLAACDRLRDETGGYFDARPSASRALDPSGFVKGWSVERASRLLVDFGVEDHCINAGGDVRCRGEPEAGRHWRVAIAHPHDRMTVTTIVEGSDIGVATSGTSERGLHVFDPHTGAPVSALASVTIVGPDLEYTDAYATAALAMGRNAPPWLSELAVSTGRESYVIDAAGHVWWTPGWGRYAPAQAGREPPSLQW